MKKSLSLITKKVISICFATLITQVFLFAQEDLFSQSKRIDLTEEEQIYITEHPIITVAADSTWKPLEYSERGQYTGVIARIFDLLSEYTGFNFIFQIKDTYNDALDAVQKGEAQLISGLAFDQEMAEEYNVQLSNPYLIINSAIVTKKAISELYRSSEKKTIAVVEGDYANNAITKSFANVTLIECNSNEECLVFVKKDKVDMAIIAGYCAEYYESVPRFSKLDHFSIPDFSWNLAFGINKDENPILLRIINKAIDQIAKIELNEAVYKGIIQASEDNSILLFVYKNPFLVIIITLVIFLVITILLLMLYFTKKRADEQKLEDATRYKLAVERTHLCIWELDLKEKAIVKIDNPKERHAFYDQITNIPQSVYEKGYIHEEDIPLVDELLARIQKGESNIQGCWRVLDIENTNEKKYWWEQVLVSIVFDNRGKPVKAIGISEDVTKEKDSQKDSLTSVFNRNSFETKASFVLKDRRSTYKDCAFIILDLDHFKYINDNYGHGTGDQVLVAVGQALLRTFRTSDIIGRLGGDEFTVFMTSISKDEDAYKKASELVVNVSKIQEIENFPFEVSCSVGVVVSEKGTVSLDALYKKADTALYEAKHAGKNQYKAYTE